MNPCSEFMRWGRQGKAWSGSVFCLLFLEGFPSVWAVASSNISASSWSSVTSLSTNEQMECILNGKVFMSLNICVVNAGPEPTNGSWCNWEFLFIFFCLQHVWRRCWRLSQSSELKKIYTFLMQKDKRCSCCSQWTWCVSAVISWPHLIRFVLFLLFFSTVIP